MTNRADQFVNRARNAVRRFQVSKDYETTMDLLTEHAYRVLQLNSRIVGIAAQMAAVEEIYRLMEWLQAHEAPHVVSDQFALLTNLGDGCYATPKRNPDY